MSDKEPLVQRLEIVQPTQKSKGHKPRFQQFSPKQQFEHFWIAALTPPGSIEGLSLRAAGLTLVPAFLTALLLAWHQTPAWLLVSFLLPLFVLLMTAIYAVKGNPMLGVLFCGHLLFVAFGIYFGAYLP